MSPRVIREMKHRAELLAPGDDTDGRGQVIDDFAVVATVWSSLTSPSSRRQIEARRDEYPLEKLATVYPHEAAVEGNRIRIGGIDYDIIGADTTGELWHLDLSRVVK